MIFLITCLVYYDTNNNETNVKLASLLDKKVFDRKILEIPVVCLIPL